MFAEAERYALDGRVIPSHGAEMVLIDHHDLTPGQREESVFVVCDKSQNLLAAVNNFIARTSARSAGSRLRVASYRLLIAAETFALHQLRDYRDGDLLRCRCADVEAGRCVDRIQR